MAHRFLEALADRAGPLLPAAQKFAREHGPFEPGGPGLQRLAGVVDAAEPPDEEADRRFVEGAGALLGLLLLERLGGAGHCELDGRHLVQLGRRGSFDPFAAVDSALDADPPRAELARQVARAEAEARGEGDVAAVVTAFEAALQSALPDRRIVHQRELQVALDDGTEVDLGRVARVAEASDPAAVRTAAERLVGLLPGGPEAAAAIPPAEAGERLLPRLVNDAFLEGLGEASPLCTVPLGHDVHVALVLAFEGRARYVRADELPGWDLSPPEARRRAVRNLAERSEQARFARVDTQDGAAVVVARTGDGHDASRLLLPGLSEVLEAELDPPVVAAVPHRDLLLATGGGTPGAVAELERRADEAAARAPHRISARPFEVREDGVRPWR